MKPASVTGLIIAAGLSGRMGKFKPLCEYKGETYLDAIIRKLSLCCPGIVVVTGHNSNLIEDTLANRNPGGMIRTIHNPDYEKGMFSSLKRGIGECIHSEYILYHFIDQPFLPESFYAGFIEKLNEGVDWLQPYYKGRGGHPLLLSRKTGCLILKEDDYSNLRNIKAKKEIIKEDWHCSYPGVLLDFDTPDDVEKFGK